MQDRELLFQALFESSPNAIFIEDLAGNVMDCNPAMAALHGTTRENLLGKHVLALVPPERMGEIVAFASSEGPADFEILVIYDAAQKAGHEQAARLRPEMKILPMPGYNEEITRSGIIHSGVHFISKPFTLDSLALKVRAVLDGTD
jgi:PAS domain S-box-containing protein